MLYICGTQQNLYVCKYFHYYVHMSTLSKLCRGEWYRKIGEGEDIMKQVVKAHLIGGGLTVRGGGGGEEILHKWCGLA